MAKNDFQYGGYGWNSYTLHCGTIMTLSWSCHNAGCRHWFRQVTAPCNVACGPWLWNCDSEFTKWQHPAMWYVAVGWHAIEFARWQHPAVWQVALGWHTIEFTQTSAILEFYIWFRFQLHHRSRHVIMHQYPEFYPIRTTLFRKKMTSSSSCRFSRWRISAILDFRDTIKGPLKSPITTY